MSSSATTSVPVAQAGTSRDSVWHIFSFVYFTFVCYLSIGLPLAVLPSYVHLKMGYSVALAGLVIYGFICDKREHSSSAKSEDNAQESLPFPSNDSPDQEHRGAAMSRL